jgi:hypothetical protein
MKLDHPPGGGHPELKVQVRQVRAKLGSIQCQEVVAFVFDFAVVAAGERPDVPDARGELLPQVNLD